VSAIAFARGQLGQAHAFLAGTIDDVSSEQGQWQPPGVTNPIGATLAHLAHGEDAFVALLAGREPLFASEWRGRSGVRELPPAGAPGNFLPLLPGWFDWGRRVVVDLPALREYAAAVQAASDAYLASLSDDDLARPIELTGTPFGSQPLEWLIGAGLIGHAWAHWGEICCLKGLQGGRGYPI